MQEVIAFPSAGPLALLSPLERVFFGYLADYSGDTRSGYEGL